VPEPSAAFRDVDGRVGAEPPPPVVYARRVIDEVEVLRYTAFSDDPAGGNPAGVVLDAGGLDDQAMLDIAHEVGYSETAYLWPGASGGDYRIRYFSPAAEVPFCGHATIASAVALADHGAAGEMRFQTPAGVVAVTVGTDEHGRTIATLTSVTPFVKSAAAAVVSEALAALRWTQDDVDPQLPPRIAFAGAHHLVFGVRSRELLAGLSYDFERLRALTAAQGWTTIQLVWRESPDVFHSRVPFPVGGVVEDPATGAAAAALGAYLRDLGLVEPPAAVTIHQGDDMGRPGLLRVEIDPGSGGIRVSGTAVPITG
jgi:PhzF family phenazine biosynthesis protein